MQNSSAKHHIGDYSDLIPNSNNPGLATTTGGDSRQMMKGVKVANENGARKVNQRSQSLLKSPMEFNAGLMNN